MKEFKLIIVDIGVYQAPSQTLIKYNSEKIIDMKEATRKSATGNNLITNGTLKTFRIKTANIDDSIAIQSQQSTLTPTKEISYLVSGIIIKEQKLKSELLNEDSRISDNTIAAYIECLIGANKKTFSLPSINASSIVFTGKCALKKKLTAFDVVCGPVFHDNIIPELRHWTFLYINMKRMEFVHMDPLNSSPSHQAKYEDNILNFFKTRQEYISKTFKRINIYHRTQQDSVSCGIFVCMFARILINAYHYIFDLGEIQFDLNGFRKDVYNYITENSQKI